MTFIQSFIQNERLISNILLADIDNLKSFCPMAHYGMWLLPSPIDWGTWPLFAAALVQWRQSWCSGRLLQWQHQRSELPSPSPGPPRLPVRINAGCLHPALPGDCQTGTSSEHCRSLPPQACKVHTQAQIPFINQSLYAVFKDDTDCGLVILPSLTEIQTGGCSALMPTPPLRISFI